MAFPVATLNFDVPYTGTDAGTCSGVASGVSCSVSYSAPLSSGPPSAEQLFTYSVNGTFSP